MNKQTLEDLIKFCEDRNLTEVASGLKTDLKAKQGGVGKEMQDRVLQMIRKAVKAEEVAKQPKVELPVKSAGAQSRGHGQPNQQQFYLNKEETEEIMEKLMSKVVAKPNLIADDNLNAKIEKIFNNEAFQRMVEHADVFQDVSSMNISGSQQFLSSSGLKNAASFKKVLPSHSQLQEEDDEMMQNADDDEEIPRFGVTTTNNARDEINESLNQLLSSTNPNHSLKQKSSFVGDESSLNLQQNSKSVSMSKAPLQSIPGDELDSAMMPVEDDKATKKITAASKQNIDDKRKSLGGDQFEKMVAMNTSKMPSMIQPAPMDQTQEQISSSFFNGLHTSNRHSFVYAAEEVHVQNKDGIDEYVDDDDPGFDMYVVNEENFVASCKELASLNNFPQRAIKPDTKDQMVHRERYRKLFQEAHAVTPQKKKESGIVPKKKEDSVSMLKKMSPDRKAEKTKSLIVDDELAGASVEEKKRDTEERMQDDEDEEDGRKASVLPRWVKFPLSNDEFYPAEFDGVIYDCYNLRVVFDREKTGFEETKDFPIVINSIIAGRYQVVEYLGSAAFSKAIQCYDIHSEQMVCMKIIENNKDYFDQSVDEIKLLRFINSNCEDLDQKNLLKLYDYFYHKEHLFIVTELLRDNLYEYGKYNREVEKKQYFNVARLQRITKQILTALEFIHGLRLIHCDLKPENILIKSYSRCEVKVIDFGSSCFIHDHLSSYVQSRSYRAPEVILGCRYDYKIDMWSLGCILAELLTGYVLFQNDSIQGLLARVVGIIGPIPEQMMKEGRLVSNFFTREGLIYQEAGATGDGDDQSESSKDQSKAKKRRANPDDDLKIHILVSKKTTLKARTKCEDAYFLDFVRWLLEIDPTKRPSAKEAMQHPWLTECVYEIE